MRLFIAINFDDTFRNGLAEIQKSLKSRIASGRFTRIKNLHLTLVFIGESESAKDIAVICKETMKSEMKSPVWLCIDGIGRFKKDEGDIVWVGLDDNPTLGWYVDKLREKLAEKGYIKKSKGYTPHITMARKVKGQRCEDLRIPPLEMKVSSVSLMKSENHGNGQVYTEIEKINLPNRFR